MGLVFKNCDGYLLFFLVVEIFFIFILGMGNFLYCKFLLFIREGLFF